MENGHPSRNVVVDSVEAGPVLHSISQRMQASDFEDMPSTVDMDALKQEPVLPTALEAHMHMTAWRSTASSRMKLNKVGETTVKKDQQVPNGLDGTSLSEESRDTNVSTSETEDSDSDSGSGSSSSDSSSSSSSASSNSSESDSDSQSNRSSSTHSGTVTPNQQSFPSKSSKRVHSSKKSASNSSTSSRSRRSKPTFAVNNYEPGSLRLKIAALKIPNRQDQNQAGSAPTSTSSTGNREISSPSSSSSVATSSVSESTTHSLNSNNKHVTNSNSTATKANERKKPTLRSAYNSTSAVDHKTPTSNSKNSDVIHKTAASNSTPTSDFNSTNSRSSKTPSITGKEESHSSTSKNHTNPNTPVVGELRRSTRSRVRSSSDVTYLGETNVNASTSVSNSNPVVTPTNTKIRSRTAQGQDSSSDLKATGTPAVQNQNQSRLEVHQIESGNSDRPSSKHHTTSRSGPSPSPKSSSSKSKSNSSNNKPEVLVLPHPDVRLNNRRNCSPNNNNNNLIIQNDRDGSNSNLSGSVIVPGPVEVQTCKLISANRNDIMTTLTNGDYTGSSSSQLASNPNKHTQLPISTSITPVSDSVLKLANNNDLTIFPITVGQSLSQPQLQIHQHHPIAAATAKKQLQSHGHGLSSSLTITPAAPIPPNPTPTSPIRSSRRLSQRKSVDNRSDGCESWDSADDGVQNAILTIDYSVESDNKALSQKHSLPIPITPVTLGLGKKSSTSSNFKSPFLEKLEAFSSHKGQGHLLPKVGDVSIEPINPVKQNSNSISISIGSRSDQDNISSDIGIGSLAGKQTKLISSNLKTSRSESTINNISKFDKIHGSTTISRISPEDSNSKNKNSHNSHNRGGSLNNTSSGNQPQHMETMKLSKNAVKKLNGSLLDSSKEKDRSSPIITSVSNQFQNQNQMVLLPSPEMSRSKKSGQNKLSIFQTQFNSTKTKSLRSNGVMEIGSSSSSTLQQSPAMAINKPETIADASRAYSHISSEVDPSLSSPLVLPGKSVKKTRTSTSLSKGSPINSIISTSLNDSSMSKIVKVEKQTESESLSTSNTKQRTSPALISTSVDHSTIGPVSNGLPVSSSLKLSVSVSAAAPSYTTLTEIPSRNSVTSNSNSTTTVTVTAIAPQQQQQPPFRTKAAKKYIPEPDELVNVKPIQTIGKGVVKARGGHKAKKSKKSRSKTKNAKNAKDIDDLCEVFQYVQLADISVNVKSSASKRKKSNHHNNHNNSLQLKGSGSGSSSDQHHHQILPTPGIFTKRTYKPKHNPLIPYDQIPPPSHEVLLNHRASAAGNTTACTSHSFEPTSTNSNSNSKKRKGFASSSSSALGVSSGNGIGILGKDRDIHGTDSGSDVSISSESSDIQRLPLKKRHHHGSPSKSKLSTIKREQVSASGSLSKSTSVSVAATLLAKKQVQEYTFGGIVHRKTLFENLKGNHLGANFNDLGSGKTTGGFDDFFTIKKKMNAINSNNSKKGAKNVLRSQCQSASPVSAHLQLLKQQQQSGCGSVADPVPVPMQEKRRSGRIRKSVTLAAANNGTSGEGEGMDMALTNVNESSTSTMSTSTSVSSTSTSSSMTSTSPKSSASVNGTSSMKKELSSVFVAKQVIQMPSEIASHLQSRRKRRSMTSHQESLRSSKKRVKSETAVQIASDEVIEIIDIDIVKEGEELTESDDISLSVSSSSLPSTPANSSYATTPVITDLSSSHHKKKTPRRKINRTGFPNKKKKKSSGSVSSFSSAKLIDGILTPQSSGVEESGNESATSSIPLNSDESHRTTKVKLSSRNSVQLSGGEDKSLGKRMESGDGDGDPTSLVEPKIERDQNETEAMPMEVDQTENNKIFEEAGGVTAAEMFSASLSERVKIRKRRSVDGYLSLLEAGDLIIPGVSPALLNVEDPPLIVPPKNNYIKAGLLSNIFKRISAESQTVKVDQNQIPVTKTMKDEVAASRILPPPAYCDQYLRETAREFTLPYDIWCYGVITSRNIFEKWKEDERVRSVSAKKLQQKQNRRKSEVVPRSRKKVVTNADVPSWKFKKIKQNSYSCPKLFDQDSEQMCSCPDGNGQVKCAGDDCLNRVVFTECPANCGENCKNRRIQKHEYAECAKRFMTENKGYGVKVEAPVKKGDFILEYVGEVVTDAEFKERMHTIYAQDTHHYCLALDSGMVIDGHRMGGECRFVNHSCEPNCEMQKWSVGGLSRMALFALRDIESGEELSYDYNFSLYNPSEGQTCHCGSEHCRGVIGGRTKAKNNNDQNAPSKRKLGNAKGPQGLLEMVSVDPMNQSKKMKPLSRKDRLFIQSHNVFLVRNFEQARLKRGESEDKIGDKLEKIMTSWVSRFKAGSSKNKPLILNDEDPRLVEMSKVAQIFHELLVTLTSAKDGNQLLCEPFMQLPPRRKFPLFYHLFEKGQEPLDMNIIGKRILRGEYMSMAALETDIGMVLRSFSTTYESERPQIIETVNKIKKIYVEAKKKAVSALDPFIVSGKLSSPKFVKHEKANEDEVIRCICGTYSEEGFMIQCERCYVWQHGDCVGIKCDVTDVQNETYLDGKSKKNQKGKHGRKSAGYKRSASCSPTKVATSSAASSLAISSSCQQTPSRPRTGVPVPLPLNLPLTLNQVELGDDIIGVKDELEVMDDKEEDRSNSLDVDKNKGAGFQHININDMETQKMDFDLNDSMDISSESALNGSMSVDTDPNLNISNSMTKEEDSTIVERASLDSSVEPSSAEIEKKERVNVTGNEPYYCEKCSPREMNLEIPLNYPNDPPEKKRFLTLVREDGFILRKNDTVYLLRDKPATDAHGQAQPPEGDAGKEKDEKVTSKRSEGNQNGSTTARNCIVTYETAGPLNAAECDIFRIEELWKDAEGNRFIFGHNYLRPFETYHEPNRKFYPNEILKSPLTEVVNPRSVHGQCWVLDPTTFCKGRPIGAVDEEHVYICEYRVDKKARSFSKVSKTSQSLCTKPFAFQYFETKLKIQRNVHPHGPPSPDFKLKPFMTAGGIASNPDKGKSRKTEERTRAKTKVVTTKQMTQDKADRVNRILLSIQGSIREWNEDPADLSELLTKTRKKPKIITKF